MSTPTEHEPLTIREYEDLVHAGLRSWEARSKSKVISGPLDHIAALLDEMLPVLAALIAKAKAEGAVEALRDAADAFGACSCDYGPTSDGPERECPSDGEEAARFYLGYAVDVLAARAAAIEAGQ